MSEIKWLHLAEAEALVKSRHPEGKMYVQEICFNADIEKLYKEIPISPEFEPHNNSPSRQRWFGVMGERLLTVGHVLVPNRQLVEVTTPFLEQPNAGDWRVLLQLAPLPMAISLHEPLYMDSRVQKPNYFLFRKDLRGWKDKVYGASSKEEAEEFCEYLTLNGAKDLYCVGDSQPDGSWAIIRESDSVQIGLYSFKDDALRWACEESLHEPKRSRWIVRAISGAVGEYRISGGAVISASESTK